MRVSPDGQLVAMIQQERQADNPVEWLTIIDRNGSVKSGSQRRPRIFADGLAWTPDGREVWFGAAATNVPFESAIYAMTVEGVERIVHRTIRSIRIEDIAQDGRALVASDSMRVELRAVDTQTQADRDLTWIGRSVLHGLSSDGRHVIFNELTTGAAGKSGAFIRPTNGGPAVQLGDGIPMALSPDGKWVLVNEPAATKLRMVPTGAGQGRTIEVRRLARRRSSANWTPDGQRLVLVGSEAGKRDQMFSVPIGGGDPTPVTPEGVRNLKPIVSPDSSMILALDAAGDLWKYPLDGKGSPVMLAGQVREDVPLAWSADNSCVWVMNRRQKPVRIFRIDLTTGRRSPWYEVPPLDPASTLASTLKIYMSTDGRTFVYSYEKRLSDLYLAEGLK
jgi:Tol biopolymer transport system component